MAYSEHFKYSPKCPLLQEIGSERDKDDTRSPDSTPALTVVRQFGFNEDIVNSAVHRLKKLHGMKHLVFESDFT